MMSDVPVFIVLGGTGGIGSELTRLLRSRGYEVLVVARGQAREAIAQNLDTAFGAVRAAGKSLQRGGQIIGVDRGLGSARTMPRG